MNIEPKLLRSLLVLCTIIEARDFFTGGHVWRVAEYSKLIANKLGLPKHEILKSYLGGYLHDIGKIGIPDFILNKRGSLTDNEYNVIKFHPEIGTQIIKDHPLQHLVLDAISSHHERLDGNGYPARLEGDQIKLIPRIIAITDTFDAITSVRPYKKIVTKDKALTILKEENNNGLDSNLLSVFIGLAESGGLDNILGHSDFSRPLLNCPACGPMLAVNNDKKDGDKIICHACSGAFKLHSQNKFFELEILGSHEASYQPEIDYILVDRLISNTVELSS
ncbi:MAG: HD-GYP domain-containing protein [Thermodesulfobacteriota bacterium]